MKEPDLLQEQRFSLHQFRQAITNRTEAEQAVLVRKTDDLAAAEGIYNDTRQKVKTSWENTNCRIQSIAEKYATDLKAAEATYDDSQRQAKMLYDDSQRQAKMLWERASRSMHLTQDILKRAQLQRLLPRDTPSLNLTPQPYDSPVRQLANLQKAVTEAEGTLLSTGVWRKMRNGKQKATQDKIEVFRPNLHQGVASCSSSLYIIPPN